LTQSARRCVRPLKHRAFHEYRRSFRPGPARQTFRLALRVGRSVVSRARKLFSAVIVRLLRRNVLFRLRNVMLRGRPIALQAGGQPFLLAPEGAVPLEVWTGRYFEKHELDLIVEALQPGMTFIDVGANVGLFSIPAAKRVLHGKVFAFEPSPWTVERLTKNVRLNCVSNVVIVHSAVGDYIGDATLHINVRGKDGLNTIGKPVHQDSEIVGTESVLITTLDGFLREHSISQVDVMKVDAEGAELMVFRGSKELLRKPNAPLILYESGPLTRGFGYHPVETVWLLELHGYSFFKIDSIDGRITALNAVQLGHTMLIAVKASHPSYPTLRERAR
jgi:FkbM family methyltransferase